MTITAQARNPWKDGLSDWQTDRTTGTQDGTTGEHDMSETGGILTEDNWESLASTVAQDKCTLMLGPEAVVGTLDGVRLPAHIALATFVKQRLAGLPNPPRLDLLDPNRPSTVAQVAVAREDPLTIGRWIRDFYGEFEVEPTLLSELAALPFRLVVNTSPGASVYDAFQAAKPEAKSAYYDLRSPQPALMPEPTEQAPVVYHLYGLFEQPESMILSDSDRLDFIISVASGLPPLPKNLLSQMQDVNRTFLFLGFDLSDWQFRILLHVLARNVSRRYKSFAFDLDADPIDPATREFYRADHKIHFFRGHVDAFVHELHERVQALRGDASVGPAPVAPAPDAPIAFLCHASEDKDAAERIAAAMRDSGIRTWLDKENLRGGEAWDDMIRTTLGEEVDYVVVLQSANLKRKEVERSYVNREIKVALDVQDEFAGPRVFLIPALLDGPENRRDALKRFHEVDVSNGNGVVELVRAIKRDLEEQRVG